MEHTIESNENIRGGCVAAFSIEDGGEECLIIIAEIKENVKNYKELALDLSTQISIIHGVSVHDLVIIPARTIPKTTSGKISRQKCKMEYLENKYKVLYSTRSSTNQTVKIEQPQNTVPTVPITSMNVDEIYVTFTNDLKSLLVNGEDVNPNVPLPELGLDSLAITQLKAMLESKYTVDIEYETLFEPTCTPIVVYEHIIVF